MFKLYLLEIQGIPVFLEENEKEWIELSFKDTMTTAGFKVGPVTAYDDGLLRGLVEIEPDVYNRKIKSRLFGK